VRTQQARARAGVQSYNWKQCTSQYERRRNCDRASLQHLPRSRRSPVPLTVTYHPASCARSTRLETRPTHDKCVGNGHCLCMRVSMIKNKGEGGGFSPQCTVARHVRSVASSGTKSEMRPQGFADTRCRHRCCFYWPVFVCMEAIKEFQCGASGE
jgi:hypothetical protein